MIKVGKILTTHGIKGEVKVLPLTDDPERFKELPYVYAEISDDNQKLSIEVARIHKNNVILKFNEVSDMADAEKLRGIYISIDEDQLIELPEDHFFIFQIIGLRVYEEDAFLGIISDIIQTGSNDVYIVKKENKEILIPALKSIVHEINLPEKKMLVSLPDGLLD